MSTWNPDQSAACSIVPDLGAATTQNEFEVVDAEAVDGDRYADQGLIGAGGGGEVRRVHDRRLDRSVARKTMHAAQLADAGALRRFVREARVTARLDHPGIIPIHEVGRDPELGVWFTMKEVRGRTLGEVIAAVHDASPSDGWGETADGWTLPRLVDALRRVAEAVGYAHSQGVVHRDLKPANIMIGAFGEVFVMDWGLARLPDDAADDGSTVAGTPAYMSPEQAHGGFSRLGPASDVYALGLLLHVIITGSDPFPGMTAEAVLAEARLGLQRSSELVRPVPSELVRLVDASTALDPGQRPRDGTAFADRLRRWQEGARRRERALEVLAEAEEILTRVEAEEPPALREQERIQRELAALPSWAGPETRGPLWSAEDTVRAALVELETLRTRAVELLRLAIAEDPTLADARRRLAVWFESRLTAAEERGDHLRAAHLAEQLRAVDRGRFVAHTRRGGRLSLSTSRPAEARLFRVLEEGRRRVERFEQELGPTPLVEVPVRPGSWVVVLEAPGCPPVRYPVFIERDAHWDGVPPDTGAARDPTVAIPEPGSLGPDDCYVPGGWFRSTVMLAGTEVAGPRWRWVDPFVMRRHPVSIAEYGAFLEDLVRTGRRADAEACMPRYKLPGSPGMFELGADGTCRLRPDPDGDELSPRWPVFLVDAASADAYAAWEAARTGQPWRLPWSFEREKAARGVDGRRFPWGDEAEAPFAVTRGWRPGRALPHPVDAAPVDVSVYGVGGLAGGVQDWCRDRWVDGAPAERDGRDVVALATGDEARVALGGSWNFNVMVGCAGNRFQRLPDRRMESLGFRLARSLTGADAG